MPYWVVSKQNRIHVGNQYLTFSLSQAVFQPCLLRRRLESLEPARLKSATLYAFRLNCPRAWEVQMERPLLLTLKVNFKVSFYHFIVKNKTCGLFFRIRNLSS